VVNFPPIFALFDGLGGLEMLVIFMLALMLFGGKRLPDVAKGLGKSIRQFKQAASGVEDEIRRAMDMDSSPHRRPPVRRPRAIKPPQDPGNTSAPETTLPSAAAVLAASKVASDASPENPPKAAPETSPETSPEAQSNGEDAPPPPADPPKSDSK